MQGRFHEAHDGMSLPTFYDDATYLDIHGSLFLCCGLESSVSTLTVVDADEQRVIFGIDRIWSLLSATHSLLLTATANHQNRTHPRIRDKEMMKSCKIIFKILSENNSAHV